MSDPEPGAQRRRILRASLLQHHARWLAAILFGLLGVQPLAAIVLYFLPNYHLEPIDVVTERVVQSDGRTPAIFRVQVKDHRNLGIADEPVDWTVSGTNAEQVVVWTKITDEEGYSYVRLTSQVEGTFDVTATWHSDDQIGNSSTETGSPPKVETSRQKATVTFKQGEPLTFAKDTVMTDFSQADPNGQVPLQPAGLGNGGSISYSSSETSVAVVENGMLTLKGIGVTCITATEPATLQFAQQSASYRLIVKKAPASSAPSFAKNEIECHYGEQPEDNKLTQGLVGSTFSYTSDRPELVEVDQRTGQLTKTKGVGSAIITATETKDHYEPASASYIVVVHPLRMERTPSVTMGRHTIQLSGLPKKQASVYLNGALYDTVDTDDKGNVDFALDAFGPETELELYFTQEDNGATLESEKMVMQVDCCAFDSHPLFYRALILKK